MATALSWAQPSSDAHKLTQQLWHSPCRNGHLQGLSSAGDLSPHQGNAKGQPQAELGGSVVAHTTTLVCFLVGGSPGSYNSRLEGAQGVSAVRFKGDCTVLWYRNAWSWGWGLLEFGISHRDCAGPSSALRQQWSPGQALRAEGSPCHASCACWGLLCFSGDLFSRTIQT